MRNDNKPFIWPSLALLQRNLKILVRKRNNELDAGKIVEYSAQISRVQGLISEHPESAS